MKDGKSEDIGGKKKRGRPSKRASAKSQRKNPKKLKTPRKVIKKTPLVFCKDIDEFLLKVQNLRELPTLNNVLVKFYVDEGQGRFTFSVSVVEWMNPDCMEKGDGFKCTGIVLYCIVLY